MRSLLPELACLCQVGWQASQQWLCSLHSLQTWHALFIISIIQEAPLTSTWVAVMGMFLEAGLWWHRQEHETGCSKHQDVGPWRLVYKEGSGEGHVNLWKLLNLERKYLGVRRRNHERCLWTRSCGTPFFWEAQDTNSASLREPGRREQWSSDGSRGKGEVLTGHPLVEPVDSFSSCCNTQIERDGTLSTEKDTEV